MFESRRGPDADANYTCIRFCRSTAGLATTTRPPACLPLVTLMSRPIHALIVLFAAVFVSLGCASAASAKPLSRKVGERVTRGVVNESLSSLDTPENRKHLGNIVGSAELNKAVHDLSASIASGAVEGITKAASSKAEALGKGVGPKLESTLDDHVTPALRRLTSEVVRAAISASLSDRNQDAVGALTEQTTHRAMKGLASGIEEELGPALAETLVRDLGPALAIVIQRDLMPAVGRGLSSPEMQGALGDTASTVASRLLRGSEQALDDIQDENAATGEDSSLEVFGTRVAVGYAVSVVIAVMFAGGFVVAMIALTATRRRLNGVEANTRRMEDFVARVSQHLDFDRDDPVDGADSDTRSTS